MEPSSGLPPAGYIGQGLLEDGTWEMICRTAVWSDAIKYSRARFDSGRYLAVRMVEMTPKEIWRHEPSRDFRVQCWRDSMGWVTVSSPFSTLEQAIEAARESGARIIEMLPKEVWRDGE